ncbi:MAG: hypothetical protein ABIA47_02715 [bacterium]
MALTTHEQFLTSLERARRPIIILGENANVDDFSAAFGCATLLTKLQKPVEIAGSGGIAPKSLDFLNHKTPIRGDLPNIRKLTFHVNSKHAKIDELSYDHDDDELRIHIIPKTGEWNLNDVKISSDQYRYDLILTIGSADLDSLGGLYKNYQDFFLNTPIINIDHSNANDHFGQINLVDINAVACSEVCHHLFNQIDKDLVDEEVATFFLTGMIFKTKSFRSPNVTPKTLSVAGDLMGRGARRDEIVEKLYKTRSVETLRLWGRALARLKSDPKHSVVWTLITRQDFANAGADEQALENVIDELISSSPEAKVAAVFYEHKDGHISVILHAERPFDALYLGAPFKAIGTREQARLRLDVEDIVEAERRVITHVREQLTASH